MGVLYNTTYIPKTYYRTPNYHLINSEKPIEELLEEQILYKNNLLKYNANSNTSTKIQRYVYNVNNRTHSSLISSIIQKIKMGIYTDGQYTHNGYNIVINGGSIKLNLIK
jgi:hypothetical protein